MGESLEVASQCLQSAYALNTEDKHLAVSKPLQAIFQEATMNEPLQKKSPPSAADKEEAERLKTEGNNLMRTEKFVDALDMYSSYSKAYGRMGLAHRSVPTVPK